VRKFLTWYLDPLTPADLVRIFTRLDADGTGLAFANKIPDVPSEGVGVLSGEVGHEGERTYEPLESVFEAWDPQRPTSVTVQLWISPDGDVLVTAKTDGSQTTIDFNLNGVPPREADLVGGVALWVAATDERSRGLVLQSVDVDDSDTWAGYFEGSYRGRLPETEFLWVRERPGFVGRLVAAPTSWFVDWRL
jgi:hypothetical protein